MVGVDTNGGSGRVPLNFGGSAMHVGTIVATSSEAVYIRIMTVCAAQLTDGNHPLSSSLLNE